MNQVSRAHWGGRFAFILAAAGSAIGLGNIWKFPYMTGHNGGGAFVLVYLFCIAVVGLPILIAEIYIGKEAQENAVRAFDHFDKKNSPWGKIGIWGIVSSLMLLAFYSVVGGWVMNYEFQAISNQLLTKSDDILTNYLGELITHQPLTQLIWHTVFMGCTVGIVAKGVSKGIERWTKILMPVLFILLGFLLVYSFFLDGFGQSLQFLFFPDFSKLTWSAILEAVGHSFFTLSIGMGVMIAYGSYLQPSESAISTGIIITFLDTLIALVAGIIIFAVVFSFDQSPSAGPGLMFVTLPLLFKQIPGAWIITNAFFILVTFAAISSSISLLEVAVSYASEEKNWSRPKAAWGIGIATWAVGILCAFPELTIIAGKNMFDTLDIATSKVMFPLGGILMSLFFGWIVMPKSIDRFAKATNPLTAYGLMWVTRIVAPLSVGIMLFKGVKEMLGM